MKILFLVNVRSGRRRRSDVPQLIRDRCAAAKIEHEIVSCDRKEDLDAVIARAEREAVDVVCAVGGDGTVHEVAKRLMGKPMALGILPTGSGNGLARHLGVPMDLQSAIDALQARSIVTIDSAEVNGIAYFGIMGLGLDAAIADRFAASGVRGLRTYFNVGIRTFAAYEPEEYEISVDGHSTKRRAYIVAVANSSQYGNKARIAPIASLQDGLLDVVAVDEVSLLAAPLLLVRLFNGTFDKSRRIWMKQGAAVTIRRRAAGPAHVDGEPLTLPAELRVTIRPGSLKVAVPDQTARF